MKFDVRILEEKDYDEILVTWWEDWGWSAPPRDFLPENGTGGLIVYDGETPVCAGYLYNTNSKVAWVDWIISSKTYNKKPNRKEAISFLIEELTSVCENKLQAKFVYALIKHNGLIETYKKLGYTEGDSYNKEMIKII